MTTPERDDLVNKDLPKKEAGMRSAAARLFFRRLAWLTVACAVAALAVYYWASPKGTVTDGKDDDDFAEPVGRAPGYLGPQACAPCHARRVADFQKTSHFRACRLPDDGAMPAGFAAGKGKHSPHLPGLRFEMMHKDGDFFQTSLQAGPKGEQRSASRIDLVYGAAKADEVFFSWRGDKLYELPVVWLHPLDQWGNSTLNPHGSGDFSRETTTRCLECHNTYFEHEPGTRNQYQRSNFILGVTCERCHGPGQEHVAYHQAHAGAATGQAVVRPGLLSRERQLEVCTQCHSNAIKPRGPAFSYRPGEPLEAFFRTIKSKYPENDHVANQVQYLRQSKCFQKSEMTCTTCHNPHWPDRSSARSSCLKCHQAEDCRERGRLPEPVQGNCVGCHMSQRVWMNVHFHTEDDQYVPPIRRFQHRIAVDPIARQEVLLAWHRRQTGASSQIETERVKKQLVDHWLTEADTCSRQFRFLAAIGAIREALRIDASAGNKEKLRAALALQANLDGDLVEAFYQIDRRRFPQAIELLEKVLAVKPDLAIAHGKLGTAYLNLGKNDLAIQHLQAVAKYDPDDPYGLMMLGWLAYLDGKAADAVAAYRRADEIEPFNAKTNYHWGLALAKLDRWTEAEERYRRVLTIDPKHAGGYQALSHALRQQGQLAEAVRCARRAAVLTKFENADIVVSLVEAYVAAGRCDDARGAAAKALDAARLNHPALVLQFRQRLEDILARCKQASKK